MKRKKHPGPKPFPPHMRRGKVLPVRVTESEYAFLRDAAKEVGMTISNYIRVKLGLSRKGREDK